MSYAVKLAAILAAFCLALAAFVHAASENGRVIFSPGSLGRSGLDAHVVGEIVDGAFRAETVSLQTQTLSEGQANLTSEEVAVLSADPAALESLLEARRRMASQNGANEYPRLSDDLLALARLSYAVDPLNVRTVRSIALGNTLHVDAERARQLLQNASALSKRDEIVNLWLAQDYGRQGDVPRMLASFDHALRTSRRARESAISPLVALLSSAESQVMVGQLLRQQPQWENAFWAEFARNPVTLANVAQFFDNTGLSLDRVPESTRAALYSNLKRQGSYDTLMELASRNSATSDWAQADSRGEIVPASPENPFGWTLRSRGDFAARVHDAAGELQIDARAGSFGLAADRVLRGGRDFELVMRMAEPVPRGAGIRLIAACVDGPKRELARIALSSGDRDETALVRAEECDFVSLELSFEAEQGRRNPLIRIAGIGVNAV